MARKKAAQKHRYFIQVFDRGEACFTHDDDERGNEWDTLAAMQTLTLPGVQIHGDDIAGLAAGKLPRLYRPQVIPREVRIYEDPLVTFMVVNAGVRNKRLTKEQTEAYMKEHTVYMDAQPWDAPTTAAPIADMRAIRQQAKARLN